MELADRIVSHINPNYVACKIRLINKAAALRFRDSRHTIIRLSQPVPPDAFARHWLAPGATRGLNLWQRRWLLYLTAASGSVPNLEVAVRAAGCLSKSEVFEAAVAAGSLEACHWLYQQGWALSRDGQMSGGRALSAAASSGHIHVCEWLLTLDLTWDWGAEEEAAAHGHVDLMEWLLQRRLQLRYKWLPVEGDRTQNMMAAVARGCDLPTLQRLWPRWGELGEKAKATVLAAAAGSPTPDWAAKVEWLEVQGCPRTQAAAEKAAAAKASTRPDALERLTWLRGRSYPLGVRVVEAAAENGNTAALQYLLREGVRKPHNAHAALWAAEAGQLPALQALHAAGWPVDGRDAVGAAARGGHLHVVAWLVETLGSAVLYAEQFTDAAASGNVELMAWLQQRGCEWDAGVFDSAAESGCEEALEWLVAQGCPVPEDGQLYIEACWSGDLATACCLRRLGVPWGDPSALTQEVMGSQVPLPMLRWLLEAGCQLDLRVAEAEAEAAVQRLTPGSDGARQATEAVALIRQHWQRQQEQQ